LEECVKRVLVCVEGEAFKTLVVLAARVGFFWVWEETGVVDWGGVRGVARVFLG
jgi:hypothetical protein